MQGRVRELEGVRRKLHNTVLVRHWERHI